MKVAVITPYYQEPLEMLQRAHDSVAAQTHACTHYMIADGHPRIEVDTWQVRHLTLPKAHHNNGNTPRAKGTSEAIENDFDAIAYLDADNWFEPNHIAGLIEARQKTGADMISSGRVIHGLEGEVLLPLGEQGDGKETADTSTLLFGKTAFPILPLWGSMPDELGPNCDRYIFKGAQTLGCAHHHTGELTMHFTSRYAPHYRAAGRTIPLEATAMHAMKDSDQFIRRIGPKGLSHILSGKPVEDLFKTKHRTPYVVCILKDEDKLSLDEARFCDDLERCLTDTAEFYYATMDEVLADTTVMADRNNVFLLWFGDDEVEKARLGEIADQNGKFAVIYVRCGKSSAGPNCDDTLDRRAWKVVTDSESIKKSYVQTCRYGDGHVIQSTLTNAPDALSALMHKYAR